MMRIVKIIFYLVAILISSIIALGLIIDIFYSDNIERSVVKKIQENIISEINLPSVSFTFWEHFPYSSVKFNDILIKEIDDGFSGDTLLYAKEAYANFNLIDILRKDYIISRIYIDDGEINIRYNNEGKANFMLFKSDTTNKNQVTIKDVFLNESNINYIRLSNNTYIDWDVSQGILEIKKNNININASITSNKLFAHKMEYLENKDCSFSTEISFHKDTLIIRESELFIEDVKLFLKGSIIRKHLELTVQAKDQKIRSIINYMPDNFKKVCQSFIAEGIISCNAEIKGLSSASQNPALNMDFNIINGGFELKKIPFVLNGIRASGSVNNGKDANFETTSINFSEFQSRTNKGFLNGNFIVTNLNKYFLSAKLDSKWDLSELNHYFQDSPFLELTGNMYLTTNYQGHLAFNNKFKDYFLASTHISKVKANDIKFKYINSPLYFSIDSTSFNIEDKTISIINSSIDISQSSFSFSGQIESFISYLLKKNKKFHLKGDMIASKMLFSELAQISNVSNEVKQNTFPDWVTLDINTDINNFIYNNFVASKLVGKVQYNKEGLKGIELIANSLDGYIHTNFTLTEPTRNYLVLKAGVELDKINIRESFASFDNFNQEFIRTNHINGIGTAELDVEAHWKPSFIFNEKKLKVKSHMIIEEGELINFDPLENLSSFVSIDDLKHVKFSTLENTIEIEDEVVTIPAMEIKSSALSVFLSGTHTFTQEIDYRIKLLLSELLSNTFRKKNTDLDNEFGEVDSEGQIFNTVYLKMTGKTDDPKISFDGLKIKEDIQKGINTELETIKTIINEDILNREEFIEDEEGQDVIIEWEGEQYNPK